MHFLAFSIFLLAGSLVSCSPPDTSAALASTEREAEPITSKSSSPTIDSSAYHIEASTLKRGIAQRRPNEPDSSFLRRVLPIAYPAAYNGLIVAYAWRPTLFGKQLFFSRTNGGANEYDLFLYILDPFQSDTYAVQAFDLENMGDLTTVAAIFFADVDHDGQKELLALTECSLKEGFKDINGELEQLKDGEEYAGEIVTGRVPHYVTRVFQYAGISKQGCPRYREDNTPRAYLDDLPTAFAIRQAITKHQQKIAKRKAPQKL
jgi:hypothetical protein